MTDGAFLLFMVLLTAVYVGVYCYSLGYERGRKP